MKEIKAPRLTNARTFADRIPFYWKRAPLFQKVYSEVGIFLAALLFIFVMVPFAIVTTLFVTPLLSAIPVALAFIYMVPVMRIITHRAMTAVEFNNLKPNKYRLLDKADRKRLLPVAKLLHEDPTNNISKEFKDVVQGMHATYVKEDVSVQNRMTELDRIKLLLSDELDTVTARREALSYRQEIMRELEALPASSNLRAMLEIDKQSGL